MDNKEEMQIKKIDDMINLLNDFKNKKDELIASAKCFDEYKSKNYEAFIEWLEKFSKKLNFNIIITIRTEEPVVKIRFYEKLNESTQERTRTFEMLVGDPDKLKVYDYYDLSHGAFEEYRRNGKIIEGVYDTLLNILPWISDNYANLRKIILNTVEKQLYLLMEKEGKEYTAYIKEIKRATSCN